MDPESVFGQKCIGM